MVSRLGATPLRMDLTDAASIAAAVEALRAETGPGGPSAVVHNSAIAIPGAVMDVPTEALRAIFEVNLFGLHELNRHLLPGLCAVPGGGRLVLMSSILGRLSLRFRGAYQMTKYAVEAYADTLRVEHRPSELKVSLIEPGPVTSNMRATAMKLFERNIDVAGSRFKEEYQDILHALSSEGEEDRNAVTPAEAAAVIRRCLEAPRPKARYVITRQARLGLLAKALLPTPWLDELFRDRRY